MSSGWQILFSQPLGDVYNSSLVPTFQLCRHFQIGSQVFIREVALLLGPSFVPCVDPRLVALVRLCRVALLLSASKPYYFEAAVLRKFLPIYKLVVLRQHLLLRRPTLIIQML